MSPSKLWVVTVRYYVRGEYCETPILFAEVDDCTSKLPARNLAVVFGEVWYTTLQNAWSAAVLIDSTYVRKYAPHASIPYARSIQNSGTRDDRTLPPSSTVCITQYGVGVIGDLKVHRRSNGWSGISRIDQEGGLLNSTGYTLWNEVAKRYSITLESSMEGGGHWTPCCYTPPDIFVSPITYAVVRDAVHTRRTRQRR